MDKTRIDFRDPIRQGLLAGVITLSISIIGLIELFGERGLIVDILTMGQVLIFAAPAIFSYLAARATPESKRNSALICGLLVGLFTALPLVALIGLAQAFDLRQFFPNISPTLISLLTFSQGPVLGSLLLIAAMIFVGVAAAGIYLLPNKISNPLLSGILWTIGVGLFSEILTDRIKDFFGSRFAGLIFRSKALQIIPAAVVFILAAGLTAWSGRRGGKAARETQAPASFSFKKNGKLNRTDVVLASIILVLQILILIPAFKEIRVYVTLFLSPLILWVLFRFALPSWMRLSLIALVLINLPILLGVYLSEIANVVGLFVLMGLGLNIVVGFAGLLDLGYVAFYAIGAYSMAVLTSNGPLGIGGLSFWAALPISVALAALAGVVLGLPVLRMRGDYLAIVTLGFGEIIRIMANSDLLKPVIGGAQGVLQIPKPNFLGITLVQPTQLYYVILVAVLLVAFVAWRLRDSRLGRQWMAMREDEDVAEAMGINLVATKLLAFALGATFAGFAGAILAPKLTSIFPHSFSIVISLNVLSLIIVGGMGSLPGVVVGALVLVGLPELLREFEEFRLLMYGALLVVMMLVRPEGFWPSAVHRRELHADEASAAPVEAGPLQTGETS